MTDGLPSTFLFPFWGNPSLGFARGVGYMDKINYQEKRDFSKQGFCCIWMIQGVCYLDFILPICGSPSDYLSVHCCHHQGKHGWAEA